MKRSIKVLAGLGLCAGALIGIAAGAADLSQQSPVEVTVELGNSAGELKFFPSDISFEAGKLYKLVLKNPSTAKHYFSSMGLAGAIWTRKVEAGKAEIKGSVREIELKPGGEAEWFFVPVKAGGYDLKCTIPGHAEAGMVGRITVR